jgi:hypothetical protein
MLRCLSKFGQVARPSFHKHPVQIKKQFLVPFKPVFARQFSDLPFSKRYGRKTDEGTDLNLNIALHFCRILVP